MKFCHLSPELVLLLADGMRDDELNALARTCRTLHLLLNPFLYSRDVRNGSYSALLWATMVDQIETAQLALDAGANPNQPMQLDCSWWCTPMKRTLWRYLFHATASAEMMIYLLVRNGGDLGGEDAVELLSGAVRENNMPLIELAFKHGVHPHTIEDDQKIQLQEEVGRSRREVLQMLLERGFPADWFSLHVFISNGNIGAAELLLERGARVNARGDAGETPVEQMIRILASNHGFITLETIRLLIKYGADVEPHNSSPLLLPVMSCGDDSLTKDCIKAGVNKDWTDRHGSTYLHRAVMGDGPLTAIPKLVALGVDVNAGDVVGDTPLHSATLTSCDLKRLRQLLQLPVDLEARNIKGETALHLTASTCSRRRSPEHARALIEAGADVDAQRTTDGFTTLHIAAEAKSPSLVERLLKLGADAGLLTKDGKTALDIIKGFEPQNGQARRIQELLLAGVPRNSNITRSMAASNTPRPGKIARRRSNRTAGKAKEAPSSLNLRRSRRLQKTVVRAA